MITRAAGGSTAGATEFSIGEVYADAGTSGILNTLHFGVDDSPRGRGREAMGNVRAASRPGRGGKAILAKRVYEPASRQDGRRFLVERLWPRGVKKEALEMEAWQKDVAPSTTLRQWFGHDPERWAEFCRRYQEELNKNAESWQPILDAARQGTVTLLYSAHDVEHNSAVVLRDYLLSRLRGRRASRAQRTTSKRAS